MDEYIERLKDGSLKLYALEKELPPEEAVRVRRAFIEGETGTPLPAVGSFTIGIDRVVKRNIENMIGVVQVPLGVAGPLRVKGEYARGSYYLPLATTEGALVASVNRGCSLITRAGGADVRIMRDGMTRAPVFAARDVVHAREVATWVEGHAAEIREVAESTTKHGEFREAVTYVAGTSVFVRLEFDTKDAMGMNMVTIASQKVGELIERETGARLVATSGNMCTDKKPAAINLVRGRGKTVVAGVRTRERSSRSTTGRTWSARRGRRRSGSTPTRRTSSPPCSLPAGRTPPTSSRGAPRSPPSTGWKAASTSRSRSRRFRSGRSAAARGSIPSMSVSRCSASPGAGTRREPMQRRLRRSSRQASSPGNSPSSAPSRPSTWPGLTRSTAGDKRP